MAKPTNEQFSQMVTDHIEMEMSNHAKPKRVAMMQAAARFNAYVSRCNSVSGRIMKEQQERRTEHYLKLYRRC